MTIVVFFYGEALNDVFVPPVAAQILQIPNHVKSKVLYSVYKKDRETKDYDPIENFQAKCSLVQQALLGDFIKACRTGKSLIIEGPFLDPNNEFSFCDGKKGLYDVKVLRCHILYGAKTCVHDYITDGLRNKEVITIELEDGEISEECLVQLSEAVNK